MCTVKTHKHRFPFSITSTIVPNDTRIQVIERSPQNADDQYCFAIPFLFVFISHLVIFKQLTEIRTN